VPTLEELRGQVATLSTELDRRGRKSRLLDLYRDGECPFPDVVIRAGVTRAYRMLMPMSDAPWGSVIVDSSLDRLEVTGIKSGDKALDELVWNDWQSNQMDSEFPLALDAALAGGRSYALVWADDGGNPEITIESQEQMIVQYRPGSRRHRVAALRRWAEDGKTYATLYRPDGLYKFVKAEDNDGTAPGVEWENLNVKDEDWPLDNPLEVVPVVELAVNRRLKPGSYGHARGEYEHCTGLIDRINLLTFLGLVVAFWMGFPLRGVIGDKIVREALVDDAGEPLIDTETGKQKERIVPPFDVNADSIFQLEKPDAKLAEFKAADRGNLSIFAELDQLAAVSKTPRHYFPIGTGISNIAEPTIRAFEGGLHAKIKKHKGTTGEGGEEILRLCALIRDKKLPQTAALMWADHESRSMAERADAATKVGSLGFPPLFIAEKFLNLSQDDLNRLEGQLAGNVLNQLLSAANSTPTVTPAPEPAAA
jgi:hypothetical protein